MRFARVTIFALMGAGLGCTSSVADDSGSASGAGGGQTTTFHPSAPPLPGESECTVVIRTGIQNAKPAHVELCSPVAYPTNPPSGGPHWPVWAAFKEYSVPVPRPMYVHDMEHGAVVLAYRCAGACPDVIGALEHVVATAAPDPACKDVGVNARVVMTPDPDLATPIGAAGWGTTYTATCIDEPSLSSFAAQAYGDGPEHFCSPGVDIEAGGVGCGDGGP